MCMIWMYRLTAFIQNLQLQLQLVFVVANILAYADVRVKAVVSEVTGDNSEEETVGDLDAM